MSTEQRGCVWPYLDLLYCVAKRFMCVLLRDVIHLDLPNPAEDTVSKRNHTEREGWRLCSGYIDWSGVMGSERTDFWGWMNGRMV